MIRFSSIKTQLIIFLGLFAFYLSIQTKDVIFLLTTFLKVDVSLNDIEIIEHKISRQDSNTNQTTSYLIPDTKTGDMISVEAYCSISGKLKKEIRI